MVASLSCFFFGFATKMLVKGKGKGKMGFSQFPEKQLARRNATVWTSIVMWIAVGQFFAYIVGFYLVIRFLISGDGYLAATISVWVKIALMWAVTISGIVWEKIVIGKYFMAKEFFWEDFGNLVAMVTHNAYFVALFIGLNPRNVMWVMLFAYITYLFNFAQWVVVGVKSFRQRRGRAARQM